MTGYHGEGVDGVPDRRRVEGSGLATTPFVLTTPFAPTPGWPVVDGQILPGREGYRGDRGRAGGAAGPPGRRPYVPHHGDDEPNRLDDAERPCSREETVEAGERAPECEGQDVAAARRSSVYISIMNASAATPKRVIIALLRVRR